MDKDETERINAQNDVKEQTWSIHKQTDAILKLTKVVLKNLSEKERALLEKMSTKNIKTYVKFKAHKNRLKLAKLKKQNIIQSFKRGEIIFETKRGLEGRTLLTLRRGAGELIVFTKAKNLIKTNGSNIFAFANYSMLL